MLHEIVFVILCHVCMMWEVDAVSLIGETSAAHRGCSGLFAVLTAPIHCRTAMWKLKRLTAAYRYTTIDCCSNVSGHHPREHADKPSSNVYVPAPAHHKHNSLYLWHFTLR